MADHKVHIAGYDSASGSDVVPPMRNLLASLGFDVPGTDQLPKLIDTPENTQLIKTTQLNLSKFWTPIAAVFGGGSGIASLVKAFTTASSRANTSSQISFMVAAAVLLGTAAIAIAVIVRGDILGRAHVAAAEYSGRASVVCRFLATVAEPDTGSIVAMTPRYWITTKAHQRTHHDVVTFEVDPNEGFMIITASDRIPGSEIHSLGLKPGMTNS